LEDNVFGNLKGVLKLEYVHVVIDSYWRRNVYMCDDMG